MALLEKLEKYERLLKKWLSGTETPANKGLSLPTEYVVYRVRYLPNPAKGIVVTHRIRCLPGLLPAEDGKKRIR